MRASVALVSSLLLAAAIPSGAMARAVCTDPRCGMVDVDVIVPPPPPVDPGPPALRPALRFSQIRARLRALGPRVNECFATHFEGTRPPRAQLVTVFVHPSGRWSLAFGPQPRTPRPDEELRGGAPLEVCIADWISGELGPRLEPSRGRAPRRVALSYRITVPASPRAPEAP
jgi:hypothetical protein